jgi:hypothetical protein
MQYALMIYAEPGLAEALSDTEREAAQAEFAALAEDPRSAGGVQLQPGGFVLVEAADLDEAIQIAARVPAARLGGVVEIRPVMQR